jgi:hypothetical protein
VNALSSERGGGGGGRQDRRVTFQMIQEEGLGMSGAPAYVVVGHARNSLFQFLKTAYTRKCLPCDRVTGLDLV